MKIAKDREVWIQPKAQASIHIGELSSIVVLGELKIHFMRGTDFNPFEKKGRFEYSTPAITPVSNQVLSH